MCPSFRISSTVASTSVGQTPSRRSPRSTIRMTPWVLPCLAASTSRSRRVASSELLLISAAATTRSTSEAMGSRSSTLGRSKPFMRSRFSMRESARKSTPPATTASTMGSRAQKHLVTAMVLILWALQTPFRVRTLCSSLVRFTSIRGISQMSLLI